MKKFTKKQWIKFSIAAVLYTLFAIWMQNLWLLLGLIVLVDIFLTHYIPWGAWKRSKNPTVRNVLEWVDDIVFALVAVYFINLFVFQNYQIPSSSLEKSLLVGDYLFVSKLSYGPRVPNTPISFPLVQNTLPILNCKSYLDWPEWGYKRVKGLGHVKRNDIVVFNFPAGDTIAVKVQNPDYYSLVEEYGRERILLDKATFGEVMYRPVDKRENYVKRCIGMPGDTLQLIDNQVYIDGKPAENPKDMQFNYFIETDGSPITEEQFRLMDVSKDDRMLASSGGYYQNLLSYLGFTPNANGQYNPVYRLPLTKKALAIAEKLPTVKKVIIEPETLGGPTYPVGYNTGWTRDNFGPLWIPKKGATIPLDERNLALYSRCIKNYENNTLEVKDGKVYINGKPETSYTFKYDYYWMMGDNRHNSADSRSWGFVPEAAFALAAGIVMLIRLFCIESYRISTDSMEEALHKGDYILVNKIPGKNKPVRGKVVLFTSPLSRDSADAPLFISRCIGMPGDTIRVSMDGYTINGHKIPRSPRSLCSYFITLSAKETFLETLEKLDIPLRDFRQESFGCMLSLTAFEEYQLREELPDAINRHFIGEQMQEYMLIVPRKDRAYPLDAASLTACKEIIMRETDGKASFRDGKLYLDGRETNFFFFQQDYYWVLSDNTNEAVDSRHLGFIPADHIVGNAWLCWYSPDKQRIFKPVH